MIGSCRPSYSPFTLQGSAVRGVNLEFTRGKLYAAFCSGRSRKAVAAGPAASQSYERQISCGRLGIGPRGRSHLHLTLMHARDREDSLPADSTILVTPQENYVVGLETALRLLRGGLRFEGELVGATLTRDTRGRSRSASSVAARVMWIERWSISTPAPASR